MSETFEEQVMRHAGEIVETYMESMKAQLKGSNFGAHELNDQQFMVWFQQMAQGIYQPAPVVDPMTGQPVMDQMGQPVMQEQLVAGGPLWVQMLPYVMGGPEELRRYERLTAKAVM